MAWRLGHTHRAHTTLFKHLQEQIRSCQGIIKQLLHYNLSWICYYAIYWVCLRASWSQACHLPAVLFLHSSLPSSSYIPACLLAPTLLLAFLLIYSCLPSCSYTSTCLPSPTLHITDSSPSFCHLGHVTMPTLIRESSQHWLAQIFKFSSDKHQGDLNIPRETLLFLLIHGGVCVCGTLSGSPCQSGVWIRYIILVFILAIILLGILSQFTEYFEACWDYTNQSALPDSVTIFMSPQVVHSLSQIMLR